MSIKFICKISSTILPLALCTTTIYAQNPPARPVAPQTLQTCENLTRILDEQEPLFRSALERHRSQMQTEIPALLRRQLPRVQQETKTGVQTLVETYAYWNRIQDPLARPHRSISGNRQAQLERYRVNMDRERARLETQLTSNLRLPAGYDVHLIGPLAIVRVCHRAVISTDSDLGYGVTRRLSENRVCIDTHLNETSQSTRPLTHDFSIDAVRGNMLELRDVYVRPSTASDAAITVARESFFGTTVAATNSFFAGLLDLPTNCQSQGHVYSSVAIRRQRQLAAETSRLVPSAIPQPADSTPHEAN